MFNPGDIVIKSSSKDAHQWPLSTDTKIVANEGEEICTREKEACNHAYSVFFASILRFQRIPSIISAVRQGECTVTPPAYNSLSPPCLLRHSSLALTTTYLPTDVRPLLTRADYGRPFYDRRTRYQF